MAGRGWRISAAPKLKRFGAVFVLTRDKIAGQFERDARKTKAPETFASGAFCFQIFSF
jgi:hypothetical protein